MRPTENAAFLLRNGQCVSAGHGNGVSFFEVFFGSNWDGANHQIKGIRSLRKLRTLHIISFISNRPDRKGTLASDLKGAGARANCILYFC